MALPFYCHTTLPEPALKLIIHLTGKLSITMLPPDPINIFNQLHSFKTTIIDFWKFEHFWISKARPSPSSVVASQYFPSLGHLSWSQFECSVQARIFFLFSSRLANSVSPSPARQANARWSSRWQHRPSCVEERAQRLCGDQPQQHVRLQGWRGQHLLHQGLFKIV